VRLRVDNPGPMTLDGTNTWLVITPADPATAIIVDPGPLDDRHLTSVVAAAEDYRTRIALIVLTHHHRDHAGGALQLATLTGAPVRAAAAQLCAAGEPLTDGEWLGGSAGGLPGDGLQVITTPGHTPDSVCLYLPVDRVLLSGDTVLGSGMTVIAHPEGSLADYLASLDRLTALVDDDLLLPGHGPVRGAAGTLAAYRHHRAERLSMVRAALAAGATALPELLAAVYPGLAESLRPAAEASLLAHLHYLDGPGVGAGGAAGCESGRAGAPASPSPALQSLDVDQQH